MSPRPNRMRRLGRRLALGCLGWLAGSVQIRADEAAPLTFDVRPSGVEGAPADAETLDEKLARRDAKFRFICIGCVRVPGQVDSATPFRPIETLNSSQLTRALSEPAETPPAPAD